MCGNCKNDQCAGGCNKCSKCNNFGCGGACTMNALMPPYVTMYVPAWGLQAGNGAYLNTYVPPYGGGVYPGPVAVGPVGPVPPPPFMGPPPCGAGGPGPGPFAPPMWGAFGPYGYPYGYNGVIPPFAMLNNTPVPPGPYGGVGVAEAAGGAVAYGPNGGMIAAAGEVRVAGPAAYGAPYGAPAAPYGPPVLSSYMPVVASPPLGPPPMSGGPLYGGAGVNRYRPY